jgi:hypothetical protein
LSNQTDFLKKLVEGHQIIIDAATELLKSMASPELGLTQKPNGALEIVFNLLRFEPMESSKLGDYETAHKASNLPDKWNSAYNILRVNNSTIKDRYFGEGYENNYWLYGEDKIYRQKLKPVV